MKKKPTKSSEREILMRIWDHRGTTAKDISESTEFSISVLTRKPNGLLTRLVDNGLIEFQPNINENKKIGKTSGYYSITDSGKRELRKFFDVSPDKKTGQLIFSFKRKADFSKYFLIVPFIIILGTLLTISTISAVGFVTSGIRMTGYTTYTVSNGSAFQSYSIMSPIVLLIILIIIFIAAFLFGRGNSLD